MLWSRDMLMIYFNYSADLLILATTRRIQFPKENSHALLSCTLRAPSVAAERLLGGISGIPILRGYRLGTMRPSKVTRQALVQASLLSIASATPAPTAIPNANNVAPHGPIITASPVVKNPSPVVGRNILSDVDSDAGSILSGLGSDLPSWVASGVPNFFQGFPTGDAVVSSLGLKSTELAALPTNVLNIDPYANWTSSGWNVRFHGNVYKQPNTSVSDLNKLANVFLIGTSIEDLPESQQDQARNLTAEIFVVQQPNVAVNTIHLEPAASQGSSGQPGGGGSSDTSGGTQDITLPYNTTVEGDFDTFVPIASNGLTAGNETSAIQRLNTYVDGATIGNSTAYLVPPTGLTIISDIDDILRVTKIYEPKEGLLNSFARPFTPWENMPDIYRNWSTSLPDMHFHYLVSSFPFCFVVQNTNSYCRPPPRSKLPETTCSLSTPPTQAAPSTHVLSISATSLPLCRSASSCYKRSSKRILSASLS